MFCDDDRLADAHFVRDHVAAHAGAPRRVALGRQRAALTLWSRDWKLSVADLASVLERRPELARSLALARAEIVSVEDVRERLPAVLADVELPEPWWESQVAPLVAQFGSDLAGFAFPWTASATGNLSVARALVDEVGGFDETFVGWGLEDTDLHFRLHRAGATTRILDGALNHHQLHGRASEQGVEWSRNALRMLEKYDSLEVCLYLRVIHRRLGYLEANAIALEHTSTTALVAEHVRLAKEYFRLLAHTAV